jgi:hypothetical protein
VEREVIEATSLNLILEDLLLYIYNPKSVLNPQQGICRARSIWSSSIHWCSGASLVDYHYLNWRKAGKNIIIRVGKVLLVDSIVEKSGEKAIPNFLALFTCFSDYRELSP